MTRQSHIQYSSPPLLSAGRTFQDLQWMPETIDNTKPYIYYAFSYTYTNGIFLTYPNFRHHCFLLWGRY